MIRIIINVVSAVSLLMGYVVVANASHSCTNNYILNWPRPNSSTNGGAIASGAGKKDIIRFFCPANTQSFEINARTKSSGKSVKATHINPAGPSSTSPTSTATFGAFATQNDPAGRTQWEVEVKNNTNTTLIKYELCVACWTGQNGTGTHSQPTGGITTTKNCPDGSNTCYVQNQ